MADYSLVVKGILQKGYGVASGPSPDYPYGALERQIPIFKDRGLDLSDFYFGTLNINIQPLIFRLIKPQFTFRDVSWTDMHPPEHFSFAPCEILFGKRLYEAWVYYPHPETKKRNFQQPSLLEVICRRIPGISIGDEVEVHLDPHRILVTSPDSG